MSVNTKQCKTNAALCAAPGSTTPPPTPDTEQHSLSVAAPSGAPTAIQLPGIWEARAMRLLEIVGSLVALVVFSIPMLIIAIAIKLDSPGPVLFRHERVGIDRRQGTQRRRDTTLLPQGQSEARACIERRSQSQRREDTFGKPFYLYKFRTMFEDARERFPELYRYDHREEDLHTVPIKVLVGHRRIEEDSTGARFEKGDALGHDPRVTRVGHWLRRTSLDELPNFISVLRGDLSFVGPRPDIKENVRWYLPEHRSKLKVRPGITGQAQISGRGHLSFHDTNELDTQYLKERSLLKDIKIIFKTLWVTLKREGAA